MAFEKQVFISYAHIDNEPLSEKQIGWITRFHVSLSAMLSMRIGRKAEIWRDNKLSGNDIFADEILQQFPKTALLISVVTPRYVESEWCTREAWEFCKTAEVTGGIVVDNKSRVLKVVKIPGGDETPLPEPMKLALGYPFYVFDDQQTPLELDPAYGEEFTQKYNLKMAKLAFDIAQLIKKMESLIGCRRGPRRRRQPKPSRPFIWRIAVSTGARIARPLTQIFDCMATRFWRKSSYPWTRKRSSPSSTRFWAVPSCPSTSWEPSTELCRTAPAKNHWLFWRTSSQSSTARNPD